MSYLSYQCGYLYAHHESLHNTHITCHRPRRACEAGVVLAICDGRFPGARDYTQPCTSTPESLSTKPLSQDVMYRRVARVLTREVLPVWQ